jgi:hypothetical protein
MSGLQGALARHFRGWPSGLLVVGMAALSALLVVPRQVEPEWVPPPRVDRLEQRELQQREAQRSARARAGLPLELRAVGEAFRRFGRVSSAQDAGPELARKELLVRLAAAQARHGDERLLELRALQTELFLEAMAASSDSEPTPERVELGGSLFELGAKRGWFEPGPGRARRDELSTLFRVYWADVLRLRRHPFGPTLNEWRAYYRFLLSQPNRNAEARAHDLQLKLGYVAALVREDLDYPSYLARGVLLYQQGNLQEAAAQLATHLQQHPDGPWTLRAKNYLAACGAALSE